MVKRVIIFGAGENAQLAHYYFSCDSELEVAGFVVDDAYKTTETFCGLPLVGLSTVTTSFSPKEFKAFVAVGYTEMNHLREARYRSLKELGYKMASYVSTKLNRFTDDIGENAFILEDNTIQPFVKIGSNVVLWSGNHIGHHSKIGDHCFLTSHVVISGGVTVGNNCFLGVNATVRDHIQIAEFNMIGAGALITKSTKPHEVYRAAKSELMPYRANEIKKI